MALKSLADLQAISRGRTAAGVSNPLDPAFIAKAEISRAEFRAQLKTSSNEEILEKVLTSEPMALTSAVLSRIADDLRLAHRCPHAEVILVGSAQLGFSMSEARAVQERQATATKPYRAAKPAKPRYRLFTAESDLDVAIIDKGLWERAWKAAYVSSMSAQAWRAERPFSEYFFKGWVRPDLLPNDIEIKDQWFVENRRLSGKYLGGQHSINAGLYYDRDFFDVYAGVAMDECRALEG